MTDFRDQIKTIIEQFLPVISAHQADIAKIRQLSEFSLTVNTAMASAAWNQPFSMTELLRQFFSMSPLSWLEYIKYSRIWERSLARLRAGLNNLTGLR